MGFTKTDLYDNGRKFSPLYKFGVFVHFCPKFDQKATNIVRVRSR